MRNLHLKVDAELQKKKVEAEEERKKVREEWEALNENTGILYDETLS